IGAVGILALSGLLALPAPPATWPLAEGVGGLWSAALMRLVGTLFDCARLPAADVFAACLLGRVAAATLAYALARPRPQLSGLPRPKLKPVGKPREATAARRKAAEIRTPAAAAPAADDHDVDESTEDEGPTIAATAAAAPVPLSIKAPKAPPRESGREVREAQASFEFARPGGFALPELAMLAKPKPRASQFDEGALRQNAQLLESVLAEFGVRGQIDQIRPGPVVTLYELVPAAGVKSARVVAL